MTHWKRMKLFAVAGLYDVYAAYAAPHLPDIALMLHVLADKMRDIATERVRPGPCVTPDVPDARASGHVNRIIMDVVSPDGLHDHFDAPQGDLPYLSRHAVDYVREHDATTGAVVLIHDAAVLLAVVTVHPPCTMGRVFRYRWDGTARSERVYATGVTPPEIPPLCERCHTEPCRCGRSRYGVH